MQLITKTFHEFFSKIDSNDFGYDIEAALIQQRLLYGTLCRKLKVTFVKHLSFLFNFIGVMQYLYSGITTALAWQ